MENPDQLRLATWHRLERADTGHETAGLRESHHANVAAVAAVGESPALDGSDQALTPEDLYVFTLALASAWLPASPYAPADLSGRDLKARRDAVVRAVRQITFTG
jgi:hypothetical protein